MNRKSFLLGFFLIGILLLNLSFGFALATDDAKYGIDGDDDDGKDEGEDNCKDDDKDGKDEGEDDCKDKDKDGIDDEFEEENKREVEIWIEENVVKMVSILRHDGLKEVIYSRVKCDDGIAIQVLFRIINESDNVECEEEVESDGDKESEINIECSEYDESILYELECEVIFRGLYEFVDLNDNGVYDHEVDQFIEDYGINSFQPIVYTPLNITSNSTLHYVLLNTTDGVFATHIYFVEEFVVVNDTLITPTQVKIDIEITNYNYSHDSSQLSLYTKLRAEEQYQEKEETEDEKKGYATEEKEVSITSGAYLGIFSWKETAIVDGVEMDVLTNIIDDGEDQYRQRLFMNYPRGNHIYHDPKIGISYIGLIEQLPPSILPYILTGTVISVIGISIIAVVILRKRRII